MESNWTLVKNYVKSEFKDYLPVPSIADLERYRPLNFLNLRNGAAFEPKWYEKMFALSGKTLPSFESVGEIENFAHTLEDAALPEIREKNLCICGEDAKSNVVLEGQIGKHPPESIEGSIRSSTVYPCLGVISRQSVEYRHLRAWVEKYCFLESSEDMILEAKRSNLFIIQDTIMAEKLSFRGERKQTLSGHISSFLKLNCESKNSSGLKRPPEFGHFPIAFKIGKIKVRRLKHVAHASAMTNRSAGSSSTTATGIYRLKIEPLRDFCQSHSKRKFGKENSPSSDADSLSPPSSKVPRRTEDGSGSSEPKARRCLAKMLA